MTVCLNLGCGEMMLPRTDGWVNIDIERPDNVNNEVFWRYDLRQGLPLSTASVDHIFASHIVEHFTVSEWRRVLPEWVRVLKPGGSLVIECPDIVRCCEYFAADVLGKRWTVWHATIYGETVEHDDEFPGKGLHNQGFDLGRLRRELEAEGMEILVARRWNTGTVRTFNIRIEARKP